MDVSNVFLQKDKKKFDSISPHCCSLYSMISGGSTSWFVTVKVLILMALATIDAFLEMENVCVCVGGGGWLMCVAATLVADLSLERLTDLVMHADYVVLQSQ